MTRPCPTYMMRPDAALPRRGVWPDMKPLAVHLHNEGRWQPPSSFDNEHALPQHCRFISRDGPPRFVGERRQCVFERHAPQPPRPLRRMGALRDLSGQLPPRSPLHSDMDAVCIWDDDRPIYGCMPAPLRFSTVCL